MAIHVVSKDDNNITATFPYNEPLPALAKSSVRVKTDFIAITSNNLSYARSGTLLHWWDIYPVPSKAPAPYHNNDEWGIVPAWGYGEVIESNIEEIKVGSSLFGFWPTSSYPVDLNLKPWKITGHWSEVSKHRQKAMTLYNRYNEVKSRPSNLDRALMSAVQVVYQCGYLLNSATFPSKAGAVALHPLGVGLEWTADDADLSSAVVISLAAASKTARSLAWSLARDRDPSSNTPLGLLQATTNTSNLVTFPESSLNIYNTAYGELSSLGTLDWITKLNPSRFVLLDFGTADALLQSLHTTLSSKFPQVSIATFAVGGESKVYTSQEMQRYVATGQKLQKIQVNTSTLRDLAIETAGDPAKWFDDFDEAWDRCVKEGGIGAVEVLERKGVAGADGIEGAWKEVGQGKVRGDQCLVVHVQA
jgi:hypothetical protein